MRYRGGAKTSSYYLSNKSSEEDMCESFYVMSTQNLNYGNRAITFLFNKLSGCQTNVMTYNALRIVSTGIIYRLSNGREWVELAKNARFFSMKDQEEF